MLAGMGDLLARLQQALGDVFRIEKELGGGGMSRLFLATETSLHRQVVIKLLPPEYASDVSAARFQQEIQVAAQLQHPNILPVLSAGARDDLLFYVMPFVSGESLRHRLTRDGTLPVADAVRILHEVADALAHAHAEGVIHRDIKPENILLEGVHAVLTDFGVARALAQARSGGRLTDTGVAIGTPADMSPGQAAGERSIDARADVFGLAVVGYEMLAGFPPFAGPTAQSLITAHLTVTPKPLADARPETPPDVITAIMWALAKDPNARLRTAAEFRDAIGQSFVSITSERRRQPFAVVATRPRWLKAVLGVAGLVVVAASAIVLSRPSPEAVTLGKVTQITFEPGLEIEPAISPDGKLVAYAAGPMSRMRIFVRQPGGRPVALTADSGSSQRRPLWSPDGAQILFEAGANLFLLPALGGVPHLVVDEACCAAWSPDGRQVAYVRSPRRVPFTERSESIYAMPPDGGRSHLVGSVADPHSLTWSPDGRWLALVSGNDQFAVGTSNFGNKGPSAIVLVPVVGGTPVPVTDNAALNVSPAWTSDSRHILFVSDRDGARDVYSVRLGSSGVPAGKPLRLTTGLNAHSITLSGAATRIGYSVFQSRANVWAIPIPADGPVSVDRATQITTGNQTVENMAVSPDGRWLYYDSNRSGNQDIYRTPVGGGESEQLTTDPHDDFSPNISPDGRWVAFHSLRFGTRDIFVMPAEGGEAQRVTNDDPGEERVPVWSPDGRSLVYFLTGAGSRDGVYVITKDQGGRWGPPRRVWNHPQQSSWSPDARTLVSAWTDGIWLIPAAGGAPRRLTQLPDTVNGPDPPVAHWSPKGPTIYFHATNADGRGAFWAIPATGCPLRLLVRFDDPAKPSAWQYGWTTDGRRLFFVINDWQSDVYVAELHGMR